MKISLLCLSILLCIGLVSCKKQEASASTQKSLFCCVPAVVTIAGKPVNSVVQWNSATGEARLLNSASFADKATGQQGNLIGWVPLVNLQQAVQNLAAQIQSQRVSQPVASPSKAKQ
jgi:hypothetical protein